MNKWTLLVFTVLVNSMCAFHILVVFPFPSKSHEILGDGYVRHLLKAGHKVSYITSHNIKEPHPNLKQVIVSATAEGQELGPFLWIGVINARFQVLGIPHSRTDFLNNRLIGIDMVLAQLISEEAFDIGKIMTKEIDMKNMYERYQLIMNLGNATITDKNVQKFMMETTDTYDLVVVEWLHHHLYTGFASVFNCPYVWSSSMETHSMILKLIDEIGNPAYFSHYTSRTSPPLSFSQRVGELWNIIYLSNIEWSMKDIEAKAFKSAFGPAAAKRGITLPSLEEIKYNGSLVLGNSHISTGEAQRLPLNYKPIAGYHIEDEVPPLPENLKKILDNASNGVIYFSMGSLMKSKTLPVELKNGFLKIFGELKQIVIWKFEEEFPNLPKNVHVVQWAPQQSILAHPNCKLFVTHGGLLSATETLHFGVPIIGIPLFADQFLNVKRAVRKGFALQVDLDYDAPEKLKVAIEEMFANPKYAQKVKELSFIYHHRPAKPGAELVHWIEHVIETKGALHLRSPALHVPLYQKLFLDLIGLVLLGVSVVVVMASKLLGSVRKTDSKQKRC